METNKQIKGNEMETNRLKFNCDTCDKDTDMENLKDDTIMGFEEYICISCDSKGLGNRNLAKRIYKGISN